LNISTANPIGTSHLTLTTEWNPTISLAETTLPTKINQTTLGTSTFSTGYTRSITTTISMTSIATRSTAVTSYNQTSVSKLTSSLTLPDNLTESSSFTNTIDTNKEENLKSSDSNKTLMAILLLSIVPGVFIISVIGVLTFYFIRKYSFSKITPRSLNDMEMN
jgi:hypothetical protein